MIEQLVKELNIDSVPERELRKRQVVAAQLVERRPELGRSPNATPFPGETKYCTVHWRVVFSDGSTCVSAPFYWQAEATADLASALGTTAKSLLRED